MTGEGYWNIISAMATTQDQKGETINPSRYRRIASRARKDYIPKLVLLVLGTLLGVVILEVALRITRPDLKTLVEYETLLDRFRIYTNPRNHSFQFPHPDRKTEHLVLHNSLGLRQSREFQMAKPSSTIRIGVFGDSFTENLAMEVQYVFTEPLDYLLNRTGRSFEVINFGTNGYGTDQAYLQYLDEGRVLDLDVVFYLHCQNDLGDIIANRLIDLDASGQLRYRPAKPVGLVKWILRHLYLTYFLIDKASRFSASFTSTLEDGLDTVGRLVVNHVWDLHHRYQSALMKREEISDPDLRNALRLFSTIMKAWSEKSQEGSATLYMGVLPGYSNELLRRLDPNQPFDYYNIAIAQLVEEVGIETLNLRPFFVEMEKQDIYGFPLNDGHWGEEGNKLAAVILFKFLANKLNLSEDDDFIKKRLFEYYSSFSPSQVSTAWQTQTLVPDTLKKEIFSKYLALERHDNNETPR